MLGTDGENLRQDAEKALDQPRIEVPPGLIADIGDGLVNRPRPLVRTNRGEGVENVADGDNPRLDRDGLADAAGGITATVPLFVMAEGDKRGHTHHRRRVIVEYGPANFGVYGPPHQTLPLHHGV